MSTEAVPKLFSPIQVGRVTLSHRVVMAPLTRLRSNPDDSPSDMMIKHYCQRASEGGLIIIESAAVSPYGRGYRGAPGIYADEHIAGFKKIADTVHTQGGRVFLQLYHSGRTSHVSLQPDGGSPVAPSVVPYHGVAFTTEGFVPVSPMRELRIEEIPAIIEAYRQAARRGLEAGLDGVELHSANGYLMDQFLQDGSNKRTDAYGGPIENRARFMLEVTEALVSVWGGDRVGVRIGPSGSFNEMSDSNPEALFGYVAGQLNRFGLAYLHVIEPRIKGDVDKENAQNDAPVASAFLRKIFQGPILAAGGFTRESAEAILERGDADLVAFGRFFAANPDLPKRLKFNLPLNPYDRSAFWGGTERGYNDYPFYEGKGETCFAHELQI
ncbi:MAG TPA: alkene reductase [Candidatus Methylacidiphilales bacterium]